MKKLVIFDIDGTLLHSNRADSICFAKAFNTVFGFELPSLDWSYYPHTMDTAIVDALFKEAGRPHPSPEVLEDFKDYYVGQLEAGRKDSPEDFMEVPGARQLVERLVADDDYIVGIGTGGFRKPAFVKLRHVGIDTLDLYMAFADGNYSREDMVNEVLGKVGKDYSKLERIVYVGDGLWDVRTTRNLNIPFIGLRHKNDHQILHDEGAKHVITDYLDQEVFIELIEKAEVPELFKNV